MNGDVLVILRLYLEKRDQMSEEERKIILNTLKMVGMTNIEVDK